MKSFRYILLTCIALPFCAISQHVGIGTLQPAELLHIKDGMIRLEGNDTYFDMYTSTAFRTGLRFHTNNVFKGGWFYQSASNRLNLTNSIFVNGFVYDLNSNKSFIGRDFTISPAESFGIRSTVTAANYGGMYVETSGHTGAKPFYGYAMDSVATAWHYFDGVDSRWKLYVGGDRISVENTGNVGIGVLDPVDRLHVLNAIRVDGVNPALRFYQGATQRAYFQHNSPTLLIRNVENGQLLLGTNNTTQMAFDPSGEVGIGTTAPDDKLHVTGTIRIDNIGTPQLRFHQGATFAGFIQSSGGEFMISNKLTGNLTFRTSDIVRMAITNTGSVTIGTSLPAVGYKLSVDGKIIAEELKVQMSELWPDYVFSEDYRLLSLSDLKEYLSEHRHLPGIPSAGDVTNAQGIEVGEMHRLLLEKIEELTLYIIDLQDQIDTFRNH